MIKNSVGKNKEFYPINALKSGSKLCSLDKPLVMGILNISPDSFYAGSRFTESGQLIKKASVMIEDGADILDIGAVSTRPFADEVSEEEELQRILPVIRQLVKIFPEVFISVDTWRSNVAKMVLESGADMINDISGGCFDPKMAETMAMFEKPFVIMHTKGDPKTMQINPSYSDINAEIKDYFTARIEHFQQLGIKQLILDPGFGFGKTIEHNYQILKSLKDYQIFGFPILAGVSRKSMIQKALNVSAEEALNGTTVLHTIALINGAKILRVHDVKEAVETIKIISRL